jgi:hypothetical protein
MQYTWNEQKNLKCDVHMYQKKNQMQNLCFCDNIFWGM